MIYDLKEFAAVMSCLKKPLKWRLRVMASMSEDKDRNQRRQRPTVKLTRKPRAFLRNRGFAVDEMDNLSPVNFQRMFRLDRTLVECLVAFNKASMLSGLQLGQSLIVSPTG
jgi:hypothetical protein